MTLHQAQQGAVNLSPDRKDNGSCRKCHTYAWLDKGLCEKCFYEVRA